MCVDDSKRRLREILTGYRGRVAGVTLELPELEKLAARHAAAVAHAPATEPKPPPVPVAPPPERRGITRAAWLTAALAAALACGGGWVRFERLQRQEAHLTLALPLSSSLGLTQHGGLFYSLDRTRGLMGAIDPATGSLVSLKRFPNPSASALAASPEKLWSTDAGGFVYEHGFEDGYAVRRTFTNPDRRPCALHWDGTHLWIADSRTNSIYEYTVGDELVPTRQFTLPAGTATAGLHVDNGLIWVLDAASRTIHRFDARGLLEPVDSLSLQPWIAAPRQPTGMLITGRNLWISVDNPPELQRFDLRLLAWRPG